MKEFITSCGVIVLVVLVVEIFCPAKTMRKALFMAFSLVTLMVLVNGIKRLLNQPQQDLESTLILNIESSKESILSSSVEFTKKNLLRVLENECVLVKDIDIDYYIDEYSVVMKRVNIEIENEEDKKRVVDIVKEISGLSEGDIVICVSS